MRKRGPWGWYRRWATSTRGTWRSCAGRAKSAPWAGKFYADLAPDLAKPFEEIEITVFEVGADAHPDGGGKDLFAHFSAIQTQGNGFRSLKENQKVSFDVTTGPKGEQASNIRALD